MAMLRQHFHSLPLSDIRTTDEFVIAEKKLGRRKA